MKNESYSSKKLCIHNKIRKRKSVIYKNQVILVLWKENNHNLSIIPECDQVKKCIKFDREHCVDNDRSKFIFESFNEFSQKRDSLFNSSNESSENGSMMLLFREGIRKPNSYLRFEDKEPIIKRHKFY